MSTIRYADRVRCDYPDCRSVADGKVDDDSLSHVLPAGWLSLRGQAITVMTAYGQNIVDLCSLHASTPIDKLAALFAVETRTDGDGN